MKWGAIFFAIVALLGGVWYVALTGKTTPPDAASQGVTLLDDALVSVSVSASFTEQEQTGNRAYDANCAACHGENAQGKQGVAPPLVHKIYEPSHHGDMAFVLAAQNGVRAHHWKFGNMPAVKGVTQADVMNIVAYVRALQRKNGIE